MNRPPTKEDKRQKGEPMAEQGTDRHGVEYKRTNNDFHVKYLAQDNGLCSVCHGTGAKIEIRYIVRNYESARVKKKICKNLQAHERSLWICPKCIDNFKQKLSVINERNLAQPDLSSYSDKLWHNAYERGKAEAQAEIVRCKDCKWKHGSECVRFADVRPWPNDFCSRAERREE